MDLSQTFGRMAFYQILLGIVTFCFAEANPGMLLVAGSLVVLSRYVTEGPWGRPLPWWAINLMAVGAVGWLTFELFTFQNIIIAMGHFTIWLQVLLLFARKSNREYGQLLMLSLLQMIGASVLSVSIIYGALLGVYCVLALLTVLVFQLKSSSDRVFEANRLAASDRRRVTRPKPVVGRGYRWQFRATASAIAALCALAAAAVFIVAPRSPGYPLTQDSGRGLGPKQVGFSQQIKLDAKPIAQGSEEPVMNLRVQLHGHPVENRSWLMRGAALDTYDPATHTWKRSIEVASTDRRVPIDPLGLDLAPLPLDVPIMHARVTLRQIGYRNLFTLLPVTRFQSDRISSVVFSREDLQLSAGGSVLGAVIYDISWPYLNVPGLRQRYTDMGLPSYPGNQFMQPEVKVEFNREHYARGWPTQRSRFADYTLRILSQLGLSRDPNAAFSSDDGQIAKALASHLRQTCTYQMSGPRFNQDREPIVEFLFGHRTGHCELFASALAAMTRSIGMQARVVTGFRASEFNQIGGYYVVRQNDAHAWVEVNLGPGKGWHSYDATPAQEIDRQARLHRTWMTTLREAYEYIEFGWIRSVVAYDVGTRHALLLGLNDRLKTVVGGPDAWLGQVIAFVRLMPTAWRLDKANTSKAVGSAVLAAVIAAALLRVVLVRRRRLAKLKLTLLAPARQRDLARQLAFYIDMSALLAKHGHVRPGWQNPRDYALSLADDQPGRMDPVVALTDLFYRVRFGRQVLDQALRQRVQVHLRQLERSLSGQATPQGGCG